MYIKILGCVFVAVSGFAVSYILNRRVGASLRVAEGWERLLARIKNEIECFSLPIGEILSRTEPSLLRQCGYVGKDAPRGLSELLEHTAFADGEIGRIATRFVSEFGRCYKNEQVGRCDYFFALIEERRKKLASELPSKRKLNVTLSLAVSLGVIILFM